MDDVGFLATLIDRLTRDYAIPPGRVFVTGMSAGAFMANRLACERATGRRGRAGRRDTGRRGALQPVPAGVRAADPRHRRPGRAVRRRPHGRPRRPERHRQRAGPGRPLARRGPLPGPVDETNGAVGRSAASGCAGGTEVDFVRIDGGGHIWPAAFDASQASGQFFASRLAGEWRRHSGDRIDVKRP